MSQFSKNIYLIIVLILLAIIFYVLYSIATNKKEKLSPKQTKKM